MPTKPLGNSLMSWRKRDIGTLGAGRIWGSFRIPRDKKEYLADFLGLKEMDDYNWVKQQRVPLIIRLPEGKI